LWSVSQNVIQVTSIYVRDQGPRPLVPRKQDLPRRGLHSKRSKLGRCSITPTGLRHMALAAGNATIALLLHLVESYPYWPLQPWFQEEQRLSVFHFRLLPPHLCVRSHHPGIVEPFVNQEVQLRKVVFDCG
jgi:hypothetical protein